MSKPVPASRSNIRWQPTPYQRIRKAARRGTGIHLSADEVFSLSRDDAIDTIGIHDDEAQAIWTQRRKEGRAISQDQAFQMAEYKRC